MQRIWRILDMEKEEWRSGLDTTINTVVLLHAIGMRHAYQGLLWKCKQ